MNGWTEDVLGYLASRRSAGDAEARRLLARMDCPRPPPEKRIAAVDLANARQRETIRNIATAKAKMRRAVWAWNLAHTLGLGAPFGHCDCGCGYAFRFPDEGECDHWKGRKGEGAHTRENGWRLRDLCHRQKDGRAKREPGSPTFNERREAYCKRAGIPFVPRKELFL